MGYNALKEYIYTSLASVPIVAYDEKSFITSVFPYATYSLDVSNTYDESEMKEISLQIDVWDNKEDVSNLENICDIIESTLNRKNVSNSGVVANFYLQNRFSIVDTDQYIRRRRMTFIVKSYI
jgi:hypothetical protein